MFSALKNIWDKAHNTPVSTEVYVPVYEVLAFLEKLREMKIVYIRLSDGDIQREYVVILNLAGSDLISLSSVKEQYFDGTKETIKDRT